MGREGLRGGRGSESPRHLLEPALAVLALVAHPARVAEAGGVDAAAGEAGAGPVARPGLGHLRAERQVDEAAAQQPGAPARRPGGGAPAAARPPSPPEPRGRGLRGAGAGRGCRLHAPRDPARGRGARGRGPGRSGGEAARAPLFTGACPRPAPGSGGTEPGRGRLRSAPSSRARASPPRLLTLSSAGRAHRRGARAGPGRRRGARGTGCAGRFAGDPREGTWGGGDPAHGPASPAARANCLDSQPRAPGRAGASWSPEVGAPNAGGGFGRRGLSLAPPGWRPVAPQLPSSLPCR